MARRGKLTAIKARTAGPGNHGDGGWSLHAPGSTDAAIRDGQIDLEQATPERGVAEDGVGHWTRLNRLGGL